MKSKITFFLKKLHRIYKNILSKSFFSGVAGALLCSLCAATLLTFSVFAFSEGEGEREIFTNTLRFHVIANSNEEHDQQLKLQVKDEVFSFVSGILEGCKTLKDAENAVVLHKEKVEQVAREIIKKHGYDYDVRVETGKEVYPQKHYGAFSFPAGKYLSLRVIIGQGAGENWWCVLFPPLCNGLATKSDKDVLEVLKDTGLSHSAAEFITSDGVKTKVRFMALDIIERLFKE